MVIQIESIRSSKKQNVFEPRNSSKNTRFSHTLTPDGHDFEWVNEKKLGIVTSFGGKNVESTKDDPPFQDEIVSAHCHDVVGDKEDKKTNETGIGVLSSFFPEKANSCLSLTTVVGRNFPILP
jgi:hypothetical protein